MNFTSRLGLTLVCLLPVSVTSAAEELHRAVEQNNMTMVERLLSSDAEQLNQKRKADGRTPLHLAVASNHKKVAARLLEEKKIQVDEKDQQGYTALHFAMMNANQEMAKLLLEKSADITMKGPQGNTPWSYAVQFTNNGNADFVTMFLTTLNTQEAIYPNKETRMHIAARHGKAKLIEDWMKGRIFYGVKNGDGHTPIQVAMQSNQVAVVELLIPTSNLEEIQTPEGNPALHWAVEQGNESLLLKLFRNEQVDLNARNSDQETALHVAAWAGNHRMIGLLIDAGADPNLKDSSGHPALYGAAWQGHLKAVTTLVKGGAKVRFERGTYTPLHGAAWQGHAEIVRALLDFKADPNAQTVDGSGPLHKAAWQGHGPVIRLLTKAGADLNLKDSDGFTPAVKARSNEKPGVLPLLEPK